MIAIVIPTLDAERGKAAGLRAQCTAGCESRLIVVGGSKRGFTKTVNDGLRQLKPDEDVCILNDDVANFDQDWLAEMHRELYAHPRNAIVGLAGKKKTGPLCYSKPDDCGVEEVRVLAFWCVVIRREALDQIGLLDERYIHYRSDSDWCRRAREAGWRRIWMRDVYVKHKKHGSGVFAKWWRHDDSLYKEQWGNDRGV